MEGKNNKQVMRAIIGALLLFCMLALMLPPAAQAVQQLTGITMNKSVLWSPGKLAVGPDGTLYVADAAKNHILRFDRQGNYIGDIRFPGVSAIAINRNGVLYAGSNSDYSVSILKNGRVIGYLGAGKNEFRSVRDIAIDPSNDRVYVLDSAGHAARVFDASGNDFGTISGLNLPVSIDVNESAIYVIDSPKQAEAEGASTASRVSIFGKDYSLRSTIDEPAGDPLMYRPTDIVAADNILYITDAGLRTVLVYDTAGTFLGEIQSPDGGINTAVALTLSSEGILYVSSSETHSIYMFDLTAPSAGGISGGSGN